MRQGNIPVAVQVGPCGVITARPAAALCRIDTKKSQMKGRPVICAPVFHDQCTGGSTLP